MSPDQFTALIAHLAAAEAVRLDVERPQRESVCSAIVEVLGVRVTVFLARYDGPLQIAPETLERIEAIPPAPPAVPSAVSRSSAATQEPTAPRLTPLQQRIVEALTDQPARKATWIAAKLGRTCGGSFRNLLSDLVRFGVLVRGEGGGYRLA